MLLVVILVATLLICYLCVKKRKQKKELDWTRDIFVMDDVPHITSGSSVRKAKDSSVMLQPVDPFEFPRSKLVFLNTILGEYSNPLGITSCTKLSVISLLKALGLELASCFDTLCGLLMLLLYSLFLYVFWSLNNAFGF